MDPTTLLMAAIGGALIGLSATGLLALEGRVAGISGILADIREEDGRQWRLAFVAGLFVAGAVFALTQPAVFTNTTGRSLPALLVAGVLVGYGTRLSQGCTSGHGICGVSRGSRRSVLAVLTFIATGMATAVSIRMMGGV